MRMPENTGVLISAIDFPLSYGFESTSQAADFAAKIKKWRAVIPNIYVWDYMRNFDDYLTPFPVLGVLEKNGWHFLNSWGWRESFIMVVVMIMPHWMMCKHSPSPVC